MASVRASVLNQARMAASALVAPGGIAADCPAVDRLVRCAELSSNAAQTLEWAVQTLRAHRVGRADDVACQLLSAARARLDARQPVAAVPSADEHRGVSRSLAWV